MATTIKSNAKDMLEKNTTPYSKKMATTIIGSYLLVSFAMPVLIVIFQEVSTALLGFFTAFSAPAATVINSYYKNAREENAIKIPLYYEYAKEQYSQYSGDINIEGGDI